MVKQLLTAFTAACCLMAHVPSALAGDSYFGVDAITGIQYHKFDGTNTAGGFSNNDSVNHHLRGLSLTYGKQDQWNVGGMALTPEVELTWLDTSHVTSASFPGLPTPAVFYTSSIDTVRLGANIWTPFHTDNLWRAEAGLGLGVLYRDVSVSDGVVAGSDDDYAAYGQLGMRFIRAVGSQGNLALGMNYVISGETGVPLAVIGGGAPAGNFDVSSQSLELSIGYQVKLGK